jgi:hypothetical protein
MVRLSNAELPKANARVARGRTCRTDIGASSRHAPSDSGDKCFDMAYFIEECNI